MKTMEVFYDDLCGDAQRKYDKTFGPPDMFNHDTMPIAVIDQEDDNDDDDDKILEMNYE